MDFFGNFLYSTYRNVFLDTPEWGTHSKNWRDYSNHLGVLDYLTLGIPYLLGCLVNRMYKIERNPFFSVLNVIFALIYLPVVTTKFLLAIILTFNPVSLLIILAVHRVFQDFLGGFELKEEAAKTMIICPDYTQMKLMPSNLYTHDELLEISKNEPQTLYLVEKNNPTLIENSKDQAAKNSAYHRISVYGAGYHIEEKISPKKYLLTFPKENENVVTITNETEVSSFASAACLASKQSFPRLPLRKDITMDGFLGADSVSFLETDRVHIEQPTLYTPTINKTSEDKATKEILFCHVSINHSAKWGLLFFPNGGTDKTAIKNQAKACLAMVELNIGRVGEKLDQSPQQLSNLRTLSVS